MSPTANSKRKLIFLWTYTNWGGAQVYFFAIMKLAREDWDIIVILPKGSSPELLQYLAQLGVNCEYLEDSFDPKPEPSFAGKIKRQYARVRSEVATLRHLSKFRLSECVLHIEAAPWQSWLLLTILAARRANFFATLHNFPREGHYLRGLIWKIRFHIVSRLPGFHIFASNRHTRGKLQEWMTKDFCETIQVTYTSVDPLQIGSARSAELDIRKVRESFGIPPDAFVVLSVGQFIDRKGRWVLLEAAKQIAAESPDTVFV